MAGIYTSLSSGIVLREVLNEQLGDIPVYPVVATEDATPPYIIYQRTGLQSTKSKTQSGIDACAMALDIYTLDYESGLNLAERIRDIFEGFPWMKEMDEETTLNLDCTTATDCGEDWAGDCYRQSLTLEFKVTNVRSRKMK